MKEMLPWIALAAWSVYSVLFTEARHHAPAMIVLAIYVTVFAVFAWCGVFSNYTWGEVREAITGIQYKGWLLFVAMGLLAFTANYSFLIGMEKGVNPTMLFLMIALTSVGALLVYSLVQLRLPTLPELTSIALGSTAALVALLWKR
jgi:hypothetical protein